MCICTIVENNSLKSKHLRGLKESFRTYSYSEKKFEFSIQRALKILQTELSQPETIENNDFTFTSTFNSNNPNIFDFIKSGVNTLDEATLMASKISG